MKKKISFVLWALLPIIVVLASRVNAFQVIKLGSEVTGTLGAGNGGTGLTSPGAYGNVLTSNGSGWTSSPASGSPAAYGTACLSSLPSATGSGKVYWCYDDAQAYIDDPTNVALYPFSSEYLVGTPGVGGLTIYGNLGVRSLGGNVFIVSRTSAAIGDASALLTTASLSNSAVWKVTLIASIHSPIIAYPALGVAVSSGVTVGTSHMYSMDWWTTGTVPGFHVQDSAVAGGRYNVYYEYSNTRVFQGGTSRLHLRILNDKTLTHFMWSADGVLWQEHGALAAINADHYGLTMGEDYSAGTSFSHAIIYGLWTDNSVTQQNITGATGSGVPIQLTMASTSGFKAGDLVSVSGMAGNTAANCTASVYSTSSLIVKSIDSSTQLTLAANSNTALTGNGTWTSGGVITLLSR